MNRFLRKSELTERRAFIETFVREIELLPDNAVVRYTVPMPDDSLIPGKKAQEIPLNGSVVSTVDVSPPDLTKSRNFQIEVPVDPVGVAVTGLAAHPMRFRMRHVAGQSSQRRGFYSGDLKKRYAIAGDVMEYGTRAESAGNLCGRHQDAAAQAHGLVKIRLQVVDQNGDGRMVGRHILCVLEDAAANPLQIPVG